MPTVSTAEIPIVDYLVLDDPSGPYLSARECATCGALFFDRRNGCAGCGRTDFGRRRLATAGRILSFTIVHRAVPSIPTPYVSVVVELDGGGVIKSNLVDAPCDPDAIALGGRVRLVTFEAAVDDDGTRAIAFGFAPGEDQEQS